MASTALSAHGPKVGRGVGTVVGISDGSIVGADETAGEREGAVYTYEREREGEREWEGVGASKAVQKWESGARAALPTYRSYRCLQILPENGARATPLPKTAPTYLLTYLH